jgi:hypothetical protein
LFWHPACKSVLAALWRTRAVILNPHGLANSRLRSCEFRSGISMAKARREWRGSYRLWCEIQSNVALSMRENVQKVTHFTLNLEKRGIFAL